jgi:proteasome lid subunit RPN8/RPN11
MLPRVLYEEMLAQARAELPNECCGMLAGRIESGGSGESSRALVLRRFPLVNAAASPVEYLSGDGNRFNIRLYISPWVPAVGVEYLSDGRTMFQAVRSTDKEALDFLAIYHSHPTSDPVPSKKDLAQNYSPEVMNLIISLKGPEALMRAWWMTAEDYSQADFILTDSEPPAQIDRGLST